jgi:hypothetical protein
VTVLPFIVVAAFVIRPYVERNWHALQYAPLSLHWLYWYTGAATIAFAVIGFAMLGRRCIKGEAPVWVLPLLTFAWTITEFLLRPAITPHQPYASRRLVPAVLPGLILLAVWLAAWLASGHGHGSPGERAQLPAALAPGVRHCLLRGAIFLPPMIGNFGPRAVGVTSPRTGWRCKRTYVGEIAAMDKICERAIPPKGSSVLIDGRFHDELYQWASPSEGMCDVPVAGAERSSPNATPPPAGQHRPGHRARRRAGHRAGRAAPASCSLPDEHRAEPQLGNGVVKFVMAQDTSIDEHTNLRYTDGTPFPRGSRSIVGSRHK